MTFQYPPDSMDEGYVFGVPLTLTSAEASHLRATLCELWTLTYGQAPGDVEPDLERCRDFFDPTVRGFKLRERIASLPEVPSTPLDVTLKLPAEIVTDAGEGRLIVGVEARLVLGLLIDGYQRQPGGHWVVQPATARAAENRALHVYRSWSARKLGDAIALRTGRGREVLQATSVGIVLALLINRADNPDRAVMRPGEGAGHPIDEALHSAALAFADGITTSRSRSSDSRRLHGGYILSEARRRLADKMSGYPGAVYIRPDSVGDVIRFLGTDLARRETLTTSQLSDAFGRLVDVFRDNARKLAAHNAIFESPVGTRSLREDLLASFAQARANE
ncbi:MAG TPA: hypothetical protein VFQ44_10220 [Streptosporangiaceae bacterium]|nr:hypothetical protein [Streptosporangiaceae bacterium]